VVEAVSATINGAPVLAVQWHPEWKTERNPQSQAFFQVFGRALAGRGPAASRPLSVIPAKAGTQAEPAASIRNETPNTAWVPAFAGMSGQ
jgi:putative glutamine amidotransferase